MPRTHLYLLSHVYLNWLVLGTASLSLNAWRDDLLALVSSVGAHILSSLIHKLNVNLTIRLIFDIHEMDIGIVSTRQHHTRIGRYLQIKLVKDILTLVHLAELLLEVVGHVEHAAGLPLMPNVPYLHAQIVSRVNIIVVGR